MIRLAIGLAINAVAFALMVEIVRGIGFGGGSPLRLVPAAILTAIASRRSARWSAGSRGRPPDPPGSWQLPSWARWSAPPACSC